MCNLVIIPTYNEKDNIKSLIEKIIEIEKKNNLNLDILVVDDNSPDGTGKLVDKISQKNKKINLLNRKNKQGLGKAYIAGFKWALYEKYERIISMDADFSHNPKYLSHLIKYSEKYDVVIGSRYIKGGGIKGWELFRYLNSWGANFITRFLLGLKPKDVTAGFKCYSRKFLEFIDFNSIISSGYAFQVEMINLAAKGGFTIYETPIIFIDRRVGQSKISGELKRSAKVVFQLAWQRKGLKQLVKFCIVGAINTVVDWIVYWIIMASTGWGTQNLKQVAKALSFIISASSSYIMNRVWTFRSRDKKVVRQAIKFFIVATVGLAFNNLIFYIITGILHWRDIFGLAGATGLVTAWNFVINKLWTFKDNK